MKAIIDKDGRLSIERAGRMKKQYCMTSNNMSQCGDWCPLFGEPDLTVTYKYIRLCHKTVLDLDTIIDERK